jgi:uncharacterized protein (TIGR02594 family)
MKKYRGGIEMQISAYELAQRFIGIKEVNGPLDNPQIVAMLKLDNSWPDHDEVPWCSAFVNHIAWLMRLPRSKSLAARSWLGVGEPISIDQAIPGYDVVIIKRKSNDPGPEVIKFQGHVGFFAGSEFGNIHILGGNQGNSVSVSSYDCNRLLGIRRLYDEYKIEAPF